MKILLILLTLLKILAIILLVLVAILTIALALLLFVPIKYNISAEKSTRLYANLEIKWFIKAIYFRYKISNKCKKVILKVFGKTIYKNKKDTEEKIKREEEIQEETKEDIKKENHIKETKESKIDNIKAEKEREVTKQVETIIKNEKDKAEDIVTEEIKEDSVIQRLKNLWNYPDRKEIVDTSIKLIKRILKTLFPQKLDVNLEVGFDNPAITGYILALSSILTLYFGNTINVYGNFEKNTLNGKLDAECKFRLYRIVWALLAFIITKPIRKIIWNYLKNRRKEE